MKVPSWIEYFRNIINVVATKSTCLRRQVGAIAVKDRRILSTGYNGQIMGSPHCETCIRNDLKLASGSDSSICYAVHAEMNLVGQAAIHGISLNGATAVISCKPCITCYKLLCNSGIKNIVYFETYNDLFIDKLIEINKSKIYEYPTYFLIARVDDMFKEIDCQLF